MGTVPVATCLNCDEPIITGDVYEFEGLPGRCICQDCIESYGVMPMWLLAKAAPDSAWMTDVSKGTFVTGQCPTG